MFNYKATWSCRLSSVVEHQLPKLVIRVRFPQAAPKMLNFPLIYPKKGIFINDEKIHDELSKIGIMVVASKNILDC